MPTTNQCKNCESSFDASFDYCPHCGQEAADNLTFGVLFSNTISNYFSVDARFFRSFIPLMTKPGVLARRFVDGKRLSYLHPAQFYLFISVVFFFLFSFSVRQADSEMSEAIKKGFDRSVSQDSTAVKADSVGLEIAKKAIRDNQGYTRFSDEEMEVIDSAITAGTRPGSVFGFRQRKLDSLIKHKASEEEKLLAMGMEKEADGFTRKFYSKVLKLYEQRGDGLLNTLYDTIPIAMFFMLPLFAILLKIFYWKRGTFAHHMVFSFYFFTFLFTTFCVLILANNLIDIPWFVEALIYLSFVIYLMIAMRNFYRSSWIGAFLRANVVSFIYLMFIVPIAIFGIVMISFFLY